MICDFSFLASATRLPDWLSSLRDSALVVGLGSALLGVVSLLALPWLVALIPHDYFSKPKGSASRGSVRCVRSVAKNVLGGILLLFGIAMLILPGQGLLTILVALVLLDFPGRRRFERWLVRKPHVLDGLNSFRARAGRPPLQLDDCSHDDERSTEREIR
jgi:hypothetical protein